MIYIEKELDDLKKEVLEMWDLVNSQLNRAGEALLSMDKELAHEVTYREKRVNAFELKIDSDCEDIIGLYNPVALDLRFTLAMMKTSNNLERIADFCDGIARFVIDYPEVNIEIVRSDSRLQQRQPGGRTESRSSPHHRRIFTTVPRKSHRVP